MMAEPDAVVAMQLCTKINYYITILLGGWDNYAPSALYWSSGQFMYQRLRRALASGHIITNI